MSQERQILLKAKGYCLNTSAIIYRTAEGDKGEWEAIKFMDARELWISANRDLLPKYFLDNWAEVRKKLDEAKQKIDELNELYKISVEKYEESLLQEEITSLKSHCFNLLLSTATLIQEQIKSLN
jgi:hypothetical protein